MGLSVIVRLIRTPGVAVPWAELEPSILSDTPRTSQPAFDEAEAKKLQSLCQRLQSEIETAEDDVERGDSQRQLDKITAHLRPVSGLKGKARDINSLIDRLRPKLWGRITTVLEKLLKATPSMPLLAKHFETYITSSADGFVYNPPNPIPRWQTEAKPK